MFLLLFSFSEILLLLCLCLSAFFFLAVFICFLSCFHPFCPCVRLYFSFFLFWEKNPKTKQNKKKRIKCKKEKVPFPNCWPLLWYTAGPDRTPFAPGRAAGAGPVRGLRGPHPGPLPAAGVAGPGMARRLPQVRRVRAAPGRDLHMLPARRQGLLQARLQQVTPNAPTLVKKKITQTRKSTKAP